MIWFHFKHNNEFVSFDDDFTLNDNILIYIIYFYIYYILSATLILKISPLRLVEICRYDFPSPFYWMLGLISEILIQCNSKAFRIQ